MVILIVGRRVRVVVILRVRFVFFYSFLGYRLVYFSWVLSGGFGVVRC